jgi:hypothetical protein
MLPSLLTNRFGIRIRRYQIPAGKILYGFVIPTGLLLRNVSSSAHLRFVFTVFQKLVEFSHQVQQFCSIRFFTCLLSKAFPSRFMCVTGHKKATFSPSFHQRVRQLLSRILSNTDQSPN